MALTPEQQIAVMEQSKIMKGGGSQEDYARTMGYRIAQAGRDLQDSDYETFSPDKRKEIIVEYVNLIEEMGYKPVRVFAQPSLKDLGVSFRAILQFNRKITGGDIIKKHSSFFEARDWSDFSLRAFDKNYLNTTSMIDADQFKKALQIRIWNSGFTDEEILCAILPQDLSLNISDVVVDGKLKIPENKISGLFYSLNVKGGNSTSMRLQRRVPANPKPVMRR